MPLSRTFVGLQINAEWISEPSVVYLARWRQKTSSSLRRLVRDVQITESYFHDTEGFRTISLPVNGHCLFIFLNLICHQACEQRYKEVKQILLLASFPLSCSNFILLIACQALSFTLRLSGRIRRRSSPCATPCPLGPELISVLFNKY